MEEAASLHEQLDRAKVRARAFAKIVRSALILQFVWLARLQVVQGRAEREAMRLKRELDVAVATASSG